jgi:Abnormal spindle-like microcephaly-assoc'd, ASPM-SPD-2-Hydin
MMAIVWVGARPASPRRGRGWRTAVSTVVVLVVCGLAARSAQASVAMEAPIGAHSMLQLDDPASFMQAMFAEAAAMHASAIRLDVTPAVIFGERSEPPDFSGLDEVMTLSARYRLPVVADLFAVPAWLANCPDGSVVSDTLRCPTDDLTEYGSIVKEIVAHADPVIHDWEVWNEPDVPGSFSGTPAQYAWMLRTAYGAVKAVDRNDLVLLGGISSIAGMAWLAQVFAVPGADAVHAFDVANVHERNQLDWLAPDIIAWKRYLAGYGFSGPLWVTEHGYPSDPDFQFDPAYAHGDASQAAYLAASIPTLIDAGAAKVFVTERDNLGGQFASEGVLGGDVADPPVANPQIIEKPAFAVVRAIAACYQTLGRDCPGQAPAALPNPVDINPTRLGHSSGATESLSDPGPAPLNVGSVSVAGVDPNPVSIVGDSCSNTILEPGQTCVVTLRFAPVAGGPVAETLEVPSDDGPLSVPVAAVAPSVSSLVIGGLANPRFKPFGAATPTGRRRRLHLILVNPLTAPVRIDAAHISGPNARRFAVASDACRRLDLAPGARCALSVWFTPTRFGRARATLTLIGDGLPLVRPLSATATRPPRAVLIQTGASSACPPRLASRCAARRHHLSGSPVDLSKAETGNSR